MSYEEDDNDYGECACCSRIHDDPYECSKCGEPVCWACITDEICDTCKESAQ